MKHRNTFIFCSIFSFLFFSNILFSLSLPQSFGKTHFIIGTDPRDLFKQSNVHSSETLEDILKPTGFGIRHALFSPDDNVLGVLIGLMKKEKSSIQMAAFLLTEYNIVKAIFEARARGVNVVIVFDPKSIYSRYAKLVGSLFSRGVEIYVYKPSSNSAAANTNPYLSNIMHHKFIIFGDNIFERSLVWTGSFNFTYSAHRVNQENVVIFDDKDLVKKFNDRFEYIKNNLCYRYEATPKIYEVAKK